MSVSNLYDGLKRLFNNFDWRSPYANPKYGSGPSSGGTCIAPDPNTSVASGSSGNALATTSQRSGTSVSSAGLLSTAELDRWKSLCDYNNMMTNYPVYDQMTQSALQRAMYQQQIMLEQAYHQRLWPLHNVSTDDYFEQRLKMERAHQAMLHKKRLAEQLEVERPFSRDRMRECTKIQMAKNAIGMMLLLITDKDYVRPEPDAAY